MKPTALQKRRAKDLLFGGFKAVVGHIMLTDYRIDELLRANSKRPAAPGRAAGGHARAASMSPEERTAQARKAAQARWSKR